MPTYNVELRKRTGSTYGDKINIATDWSLISNKPTTYTPTSHSHSFSSLTSKPTTLSGYGITDGKTATEITNEIQAAIDALVGGAPGALDTLNELAAALNDDADFHTEVTNALADKMNKSGGTFTGHITINDNNIGRIYGGGDGNDYIEIDGGAGDYVKVVINGTTVATIDSSGMNINSGNLEQGGTQVILEGDSRLDDARPASDVYSWAKASSKPSYSWSEIGSKPTLLEGTSYNQSTSQFLRGDGTWATPPDNNTQLSNEQVQDIVGDMINITGTQSGMDVSYDDANNKINFDLSHSHDYDNYVRWYLQVNGGTAVGVEKAQNVDFHGGSGITISRSERDITISADAPPLATLGSSSYGIKGSAQYRKASSTLYIKLG